MRLLSWGTMILFWGTHALALPTVEERLRAKLEEPRASAVATPQDWRTLAKSLVEQAPPPAKGCTEVRRQSIGATYVLTFDAQGRPCHLYDLAFPTLQTLSTPVRVGRLPLQTFGARDYLDWLEGRYEKVLGRMHEFQARADQPAPDWARGLRFKKVNFAAGRVPGTSLPASFAASDLELGGGFGWSPRDRALLSRLMHALPTEQWGPVLERPESLLAAIKFNWNDLEKVYEIALDGQFLPLRGPVILVDFDHSYRLAVQTLLRSLTHSALRELTKYIAPPARSIITIAIDDGFEFLEMAYAYQLNRLEVTLDHQTQIDGALAERGSNILAGGRADFVTEYLKSVILKQPFDWSGFEDLGRTLRYGNQRRRDIKMSQLNSRMVLEDGCTMSLVYDYFGVCAKDGRERMHTMISDLTILSWNLGAPVVHDPQSPSQVLLRRGAAYMLSVGSRLVTLPYLGFLMQKLTQISKQYAFAGIVDEGFLRGHLSMRSGDAELSHLLYLQNLNAFLAKSQAAEDAIVNANSEQLGTEAR